MLTKVCNKCGRPLPVASFHKASKSPDGLFRTCKECRKSHAHAYYLLNKDRIQEQTTHYLNRTPKGRDVARKSYRKWEKSEAGKAWRRARRRVNPNQWRAHLAVRDAIKRGDLVRPASCSKCGGVGRIHGHHHKGYARAHWLDVVWLCVKCHNAIDRQRAA